MKNFYYSVFFVLGLVLGLLFSPQQKTNTHDVWIHQYTREFSLDQNLIRAMIMTESSFNVKAVSTKGAYGLMQLRETTAKQLSSELQRPFHKSDLLKAKTNILLGCYYVYKLHQKFDGCLFLTLAAYNAGPTRVKKWKQLYPKLDTSELVQKNGSIQTNHFVWSVLRRYEGLSNE